MIGVAIIAGVHLVTSFVPALSTWGIDYWSSFPIVVRLGLAALAALSFLRPVQRMVRSAVDSIQRQRWYLLLCGVLLVALFVVFRSRVYVYGDGYSFSGYFAGGQFPGFFGQLSTQVLDLILHWGVYRAIVMPLRGPVETSYVILGPVAGLLSIWAIVRIAHVLSPNKDQRRLIVAAGLAGGAAIFWFGYVESYSFVNVAILWTIAFALEAQSRPGRIWAAWGGWVVAVACHQLAVALIPALIWAHWHIKHRGLAGMRAPLRAGVFALGFVGWMIATSVYSLLRPDVFIPLLSTANSTYTAFSIRHIIDVVNLVVFVAPIGLVGLVVWLSIRGTEEANSKLDPSIVAVAAGSMFYFTFWVDPLLGAFRDWDLLAGFGIPLSIWGASVIIRRQPRGGIGPAQWVPIAACALIHTGSFVATLQSPQGAMMRVDRLIRQDPHYSVDFFQGKRLGPWASVLQKRFNRNDLALDHLRRQALMEPTDAQVWGNLGGAYELAGTVDSARMCYERAVTLSRTNIKLNYNLGMIYLEQGDNVRARDAFAQAASLSDTVYDSRCMQGVACLRSNRLEEAGTVLDEAMRRHPDRYDAYYYRGAVYEAGADTVDAIRNYEASLERGGRMGAVYSRLCQLYQWSGHPDKAIAMARHWEQNFPSESEAPFLAGTSYLAEQQYDSALATLSRSLRLKPNDALATYYLATTYRNLGQPERAKALAMQASHLDTVLALPYLELVYLAADAGDRSAAQAATREYLRRSPGDSGMAYLRQFLRP